VSITTEEFVEHNI